MHTRRRRRVRIEAAATDFSPPALLPPRSDTTNGCMSTGPHFNPFGKKHGAPWMEERHSGDLGNVEATADGCEFTIEDSQIPLSGPNSIVGRACVIHELEDDLGQGDSSEIGTKTSETTDSGGARLACRRHRPHPQ